MGSVKLLNDNYYYIESNKLFIFNKINIIKFKLIENLFYFNIDNNINNLNYSLSVLFTKSKVYLNVSKYYLRYLSLCNYHINVLSYLIKYGTVEYLYLKGIGYKVYDSMNCIFLKLGYSHYIYYFLPMEFSLSVKKKRRLLKFNYFNKWYMNNIIYKIQNFRISNIYTKKGIFRRNQLIIYKEGKKNKQM